jgi:hypothetical protein
MIASNSRNAANTLLSAAIHQSRTGADDSTVAIAIDFLRSRQLARPDVREKLAAIEERSRFRKTRGLR